MKLFNLIIHLGKRRVSPLFLIFGIFLILLGFLLIYSNILSSPKNSSKNMVQDDPFLHIKSFTPTGKVFLPERISITFSASVDSHMVQSFFMISPAIKGHIMDTNDPNRVEFMPVVPFERGVTYSVSLGMGLKSKDGKMLQTDANYAFETQIADQTVQFVKDNMAGRVFTFPVNGKRDLEIKLGVGLANLTVSIYKSTESQFLAFLAYKQAVRAPNSYTEKQFLSPFINHSTFQLLSTSKVDNDSMKVSIPNDKGIYYIQVNGSDNRPVGSTYALVNSTGILFRQDDHNLTLSAFDTLSGEQIKEPIQAQLYSAENEIKVQKIVPMTDLTQIAYDFDQPLDFILATRGDEKIFVPVKLPNSQADIQVNENLSSAYKSFLYTDRPIYKPGDVINFRGVVRLDNDALYTLPKVGTPAKISLTLNTNEQTPKKIETTSYFQEGGIFWGNIKIPADYSPSDKFQQTHALTLSIEGKERRDGWFGDAYFDILAYTKPTIDLKTEVAQKEYIKHEDQNFTLTVKSFDGKPLPNQTIFYDIYEQQYFEVEKTVFNSSFNITRNSFGMCGGGFTSPFDEYFGSPIDSNRTITTNNDGNATIIYSLKNKTINESKKITLVAYVMDEYNNKIVSAVSTIVHAASENIFFYPSPTNYLSGDIISATVYVESLSGEKIKNRKLQVTLTESDNQTSPKKYAETTATTNEEGVAVIKLDTPDLADKAVIQAILKINTLDTYENSVISQRFITVNKEKPNRNYWDQVNTTPIFFKMRTNKNSYTLNDNIEITISSPKSVDALLSLERGRIYTPKIVHIPQGESTISIPVTEQLSPNISAVFSFFTDGIYYSEGLTLNVPAMHKLLNVELIPNKPSYQPGDTAIVTIKVSDKNGQGVATSLSMAVVDKAIFALRKNATPPIHSTLFAFRPRKINSSSSLTWVGTYDFGGRGGGGGGGGNDGKNVDTLYWNPDIKTDSNGLATVSVPLSAQITTWKALVYGTNDLTDVGQGEVEFVSSK